MLKSIPIEIANRLAFLQEHEKVWGGVIRDKRSWSQSEFLLAGVFLTIENEAGRHWLAIEGSYPNVYVGDLLVVGEENRIPLIISTVQGTVLVDREYLNSYDLGRPAVQKCKHDPFACKNQHCTRAEHFISMKEKGRRLFLDNNYGSMTLAVCRERGFDEGENGVTWFPSLIYGSWSYWEALAEN